MQIYYDLNFYLKCIAMLYKLYDDMKGSIIFTMHRDLK